METNRTTLEVVNEFAAISDTMDDPDIDNMLAIIVKIIANPDIAQVKTAALITKCQALAAKFSMLATYYANVKKDERAKKNLYFTAAKALDDLVSALKYNMKGPYG